MTEHGNICKWCKGPKPHELVCCSYMCFYKYDLAYNVNFTQDVLEGKQDHKTPSWSDWDEFKAKIDEIKAKSST